MSEHELERLLRERAEGLSRRVLSQERAAALRAQIASEAARESARRPLGPRLLRLGLAAAAAVLIWIVATRFERPAHYGALALETTLLDGLGRPLEGSARGAQSESVVRGGELLLELEAPEPGCAALVLYDAKGFRHLPPAAQALAVGPRVVVEQALSLAPLSEPAAEPATLYLLVIGTLRPLSDARLRSLLPERLETSTEAALVTRVQELAQALERELGCTVALRGLRLAPR